MPNYALNEHYESFIRKQLESGCSNNASEVVRAGLRMLEDFEAEREKWLREEIPARLAELQRDPARGIPAETVFSRLEARHRAKQAKAGQGMEYRVVFHPKAESELEALYDDIVERAAPSVAWNLAAVSATIVLACRGFLKGVPRGMRSCPGCGLLVTGAPSASLSP
jgi:antitoxin ParD1/3/4